MLQEELQGVQEQVLLAPYTTFRIGGLARYFFVAHTTEDIVRAVIAARTHNIPYFLLSGGSNVLVADNGFNGLVVNIQHTKYKILNTRVWAEAGVAMETLVAITTQQGLAGLEWAGGLPGTVGGAVRGNAGAFGGEIKDSIHEVEALDAAGNKKTFSRAECNFGYRSSVYKEYGYIVLEAIFQLKPGSAGELQRIAKEHIEYRNTRHPLEYPNAGSVFKNCNVQDVSEEVQEQFAHVVKQDPFPVIPAAAIIATANLAGAQVGGAMISKKHPNYIVNTGNATASDVLQLIERVQQHVYKTFRVHLEPEIQYVS